MLIFFAFQGHAEPVPTPGGLLQYNDQSDFERAFPNLPKEDFEESPIPDNNVLVFPEPLNNATNVPGVFVPGDILDGLTIQTVEGVNPSDGLAILGNNFAGNTTNAVGINLFADTMDILFTGSDDIHAVGMDLMLFTAPASVTISLFGPGGSLLEALTPTIQTTETFFGIYSNQPITRITVASAGDAEIVDNLQFGTFNSGVTFYTDQSAFETAWPGLPIEDFEESPVADTTLLAFPEPLDKTTNAPGAFAPGDILDDIHIQSITNSSTATALQVVGDNYAGSMGNPTKVVCDGPTGDDLRVLFVNMTATEYEVDTYAIGMDLWQWAPSNAPPVDGIVAVYDIGGKLLGAETVAVAAGQGNFIGISSNQVLVVITFQLLGPPSECIDNIQYGGSVAGLTFYRSRDDFKKARSNLPMEDFSESPVADNTSQLCSEPIDSSTNETGCFAPGDILPNISFQTESSLNPACPACLTLYGADTPLVGNATPMLVAAPPDLLEMSFTGKRVHFVGFNSYLLSRFSIYGLDDTLLGTSVRYSLTPGLPFWGVESTMPISRITIWGSPALVNDVSFGGKFPWPMYGPATEGAGTPAP